VMRALGFAMRAILGRSTARSRRSRRIALQRSAAVRVCRALVKASSGVPEGSDGALRLTSGPLDVRKTVLHAANTVSARATGLAARMAAFFT
jgi:hypothetical protein